MKVKSERAKKNKTKFQVYFLTQCDAIALSFYAVDKIDLELNEDIYSYILVISLCSFCCLIVYFILWYPEGIYAQYSSRTFFFLF